MIDGVLFDVYPDYKKGMMRTWVLTTQGPRMIQEPYHPCFYVWAASSDLHTLAANLHTHPYVGTVCRTERNITLGSSKKTTVLQITPTHLIHFHQVAQMIDRWGDFHRYHLYDVDLRLPSRYLQEKQLFFNAHVTWKNKTFVLHDEQWAVDYPPPSFSTATLSVTRKQHHSFPSVHDKISCIQINDLSIEEENEEECILSTIKHIQAIDPDMIYTANGDSILFPYLLQRACLYGLKDQFILSRDTSVVFNPVKQASSYFSYGRIIHRPAFYTLAGRAHIDTSNSFFYSECGLYGLLDVSRCANISLQLLSRLGAGTAISQIQVNTAREQGYLVPWKKNQPEMWKTASELLSSDRGGLILDPSLGVHEDVIELDYASLYPNIMLVHNISPETLLCSCCPDSYETVPQLPYHICMKTKGLLPTVLRPILDRRFLFKARSKNTAYDTHRYQQLQQAWKWILLVCFGYTGYRNARYGRIECHESITAFSREMLITAMHLAEHYGYDVLHGIIDSLWIKPQHPSRSPQSLAREISRRTGVRMDVEGRYHWIVFLPSKGAGVGALNRYYGLFDDGALKVRGVELRQHQTPPFFKQMQHQMLTEFERARTKEELYRCILQALYVVDSHARALVEGRYDPLDLVFTMRVSKDCSAYKMDTLVKAALQDLQEYNVQIHPGQMVRYVVTDEKNRELRQRVCLLEMISKDVSVDVSFYLRYLIRCAETILSPFGYNKESIHSMIQKGS